MEVGKSQLKFKLIRKPVTIVVGDKVFIISRSVANCIPKIRDMLNSEKDCDSIEVNGDPLIFDIILNNIKYDYEDIEKYGYIDAGIGYQEEISEYGFEMSPDAKVIDTIIKWNWWPHTIATIIFVIIAYLAYWDLWLLVIAMIILVIIACFIIY